MADVAWSSWGWWHDLPFLLLLTAQEAESWAGTETFAQQPTASPPPECSIISPNSTCTNSRPPIGTLHGSAMTILTWFPRSRAKCSQLHFRSPHRHGSKVQSLFWHSGQSVSFELLENEKQNENQCQYFQYTRLRVNIPIRKDRGKNSSGGLDRRRLGLSRAVDGTVSGIGAHHI